MFACLLVFSTHGGQKPDDALSRIQVSSKPILNARSKHADTPNPLGLNVENARRLLIEHGMEWCFAIHAGKEEHEAFGNLFWICPQQAWRRLVSGNVFSNKNDRIVSVNENGAPNFLYSPLWYTDIEWVAEYPQLQKLIIDPTLVYPEASSTRTWSINLFSVDQKHRSLNTYSCSLTTSP